MRESESADSRARRTSKPGHGIGINVEVHIVHRHSDRIDRVRSQVWGARSYLTSGSSLSQYDYVRDCVRLEKDVRLALCERRAAALARAERDDARAAHLALGELLPAPAPALSFDNLSILLGRYYRCT